MSNDPRFERLEREFHRLVGAPPDQRAAELSTLEQTDPELAEELRALLELPSGVATREQALDQLAAATRSSSQPPAQQPEISGFELLHVLGEGGMGQVWEAEQLEPVRRRVALKLLRRGLDTQRVLARFDAERQALAVMSHPHVARVYAAGSTSDGRPWFAMELVDGVPIDQWADEHQLGLEARLELLLPVCSAIQHAHSKGLVHRDLKPSNLLVTEVDGVACPKVVDFGIAKSIEEPLLARSNATRFGELVGTLEYLSPEQATLGAVDIDTRSDVYGLGLVLYQLLVGELPIPLGELRQQAFDELCRRIREEPTPRPSERLRARSRGGSPTAPSTSAHRVDGDLDRVVLKALAKDRDQRYGSAAELAADLERFLRNEPVTATPPSWSYRSRKFVRRHLVAVTAAATVLAAMVAGTTAATIGLMRARTAEAEARGAEQRAADALATSEATTEFMVSLFRAADPRERPGMQTSAAELLDRGADRIRSIENPAVQARLLEALGDASWALGNYDRASALLEDAIALRTAGPAADPLRLAAALDRLGGVERDRGDLDAAEAAHRRALEVLESVDALETHDAARTLNNLAIVLRRRNAVDEATATYEQVIDLTRRLDAEPTTNLASAHANLAALLQFRGESARSQAANLEALRLFQGLLPENHPDLATLHTNIALASKALGDLALALTHSQAAVRIARASLPPTHPNLALDLHALGGVQLRAGQLEQARATFDESLAILSAAGSDSFLTTLPRGSFGSTALAANQPERAQQALAAVVAELEASAHPQAPRHLIAWSRQLAIAERRLGRLDAAETTATRCFELAEELERPTDAARALLLRALIAHDRSDPRAEEWLDAAITASECVVSGPCDLDRPDAGVTRAQWWALTGEEELALAGVLFGIDGPGWTATMLEEPDLVALRDHPRWVEAKARLKNRLAAVRDSTATAAR